MKVLGIDPGSRYCGFGVVEDAGGGRVRYLDCGVIALADAGAIESRLAALHAELCATLARHRPEIVAVEDVFHARNARSAFVLGQARGVALLAAAQSGAKVKSFAPAVIKQAVTGTGRAEKDQVARMVCALLGIDVGGRADATDALAAALCGILRAHDPAQLAGTTVHRDPRRSFARLLRGSR
ncbi:MAG: crossover junction endodeoxyribonuclease RuvC [Myxococcales bacterium]